MGVAKRLGYIPNPELGRLMFLLRSRQVFQTRATVAVLSVKGNEAEDRRFQGRLAEGMRQRATDLGYNLDFISVDTSKTSAARLTHILLYRGVKGVVLTACGPTTDAGIVFDYARFSVVSTACHARHLAFARVVPHYAQNAEVALVRLKNSGYRRIGWVMPALDEAAYRAAKIMAHQIHDLSVLPTIVGLARPGIVSWLKRYQPDALLISSAEYAEQMADVMGPHWKRELPVFLLDHPGVGRWMGIDRHPDTIGRLAVDTLSRLIESGQRGVPVHGAVTMIEGSWQVGSSAEVRPPPKLASRELREPSSIDAEGAAAFSMVGGGHMCNTAASVA